MRRMRHGPAIVASALLGAATTLAQLPLAAWTMGPLPRTADFALIRGGCVWQVVERRGAVVHWVNLESDERLVNARPDDGKVPAWAEPAPRTDERLTRTAAVAVGWPMPMVTCRWTAVRNDVNFPPPATNDDSGWAPKDAVHRLRQGDPAGTVAVNKAGAAVDLVLATGAWYTLVVVGAAGVRRLRCGVTPPG